MNNARPTAKKHWEKPELTVLVRNKPEEQVLNACKTFGPGLAGQPQGYNNSCQLDKWPVSVCGYSGCSTPFGS